MCRVVVDARDVCCEGVAASDHKALGMPSRLQSELWVVQGCPLLAIEWTAIAIDQNEEPHTCMDLSRGAGREHMPGTGGVHLWYHPVRS